jgi:hypothetical protein
MNTKNVRSSWIFVLAATLLFASVLVFAQQSPETPAASATTLTNADVEKMVEAKLADPIIIAKIHASTCNFDTSTATLLKLKAAGISDAVIQAMVEVVSRSGDAASTSSKSPEPDPNDPKSHHDAGIYWRPKEKRDKQLVSLESSVYSQSKATGMFGSAMSMGISKVKWKIVINGDRAVLHITEPAPEFWFYFGTGQEAFSSGPSSPDDFLLVRLEKKGKNRELVVGQVGLTGTSAGTRSKDTITLESKQVAPGIYQVRPNRPLEPGEYAFLRAGMNIENLASGKVFDFGVDPVK